MISKEQLLHELRDNSYVMLRPSAVAGVGVIAIRDIPKGCREMFTRPDPNDQWITITKAELEELPEHAQYLVHNYCLFDDEKFYVPAEGFKKIDVSLCLNHSDTPNVVSIDDGEYFEALRDIKAGEELFLDYGTIVDGED